MRGDSGRITVRERIDPEITATLFANYRSSADALMELVDNEVSPGERFADPWHARRGYPHESVTRPRSP
jgi:hypothetical protein